MACTRRTRTTRSARSASATRVRALARSPHNAHACDVDACGLLKDAGGVGCGALGRAWGQSCARPFHPHHTARARELVVAGLYIADRNLNNNRNKAINTRQNENGNRNGFECPEERDYYPYWHPTPWRDIAVFTDDVALCPMYDQASQNRRGKGKCCNRTRYEEDGACNQLYPTPNQLQQDGNAAGERPPPSPSPPSLYPSTTPLRPHSLRRKLRQRRRAFGRCGVDAKDAYAAHAHRS